MRTMASRTLAALLAAACVTAVVPASSRADDQGVTGLKLVLIDKYGVSGKAKAVFVSKDTTAGAIHNGSGSGDPADLSGTVRICPTAAPGNVGVYALPSPWLVNKPTVSKYVNKTAAPGSSGLKVVAVKPGKVLKVVAKNLGDGDAASGDDGPTDLDLNDPPGTCTVSVGDTMAVEVEIVDAAGPATHRMCAQFTVDAIKSIGGGTGCKVISRTSAAGTCGGCGGVATTTTSASTSSTAGSSTSSTASSSSSSSTTTTTATSTTLPLADHYRVYQAAGPSGPQVTLADQFFPDPELTPLGNVAFFMPPVDKNDEGILNPGGHLTCYDITGAFGATANVVNQFGPQSIEVQQPDVLCVPTDKLLDPDPTGPVDHYKCYEASGLALGLPAHLVDQFQVQDVTVLDPFLFCNPADKNGEGILDPQGHLTCYRTDPPTGDLPGLVPVANQFGTFDVNVGPPIGLCVPSIKVSWTPLP